MNKELQDAIDAFNNNYAEAITQDALTCEDLVGKKHAETILKTLERSVQPSKLGESIELANAVMLCETNGMEVISDAEYERLTAQSDTDTTHIVSDRLYAYAAKGKAALSRPIDHIRDHPKMVDVSSLKLPKLTFKNNEEPAYCAAKQQERKGYNQAIDELNKQGRIVKEGSVVVKEVYNGGRGFEPAIVVRQYKDKEGRELADVRFLRVVYKGKHSYFEGRFLGYVDKFSWWDPDGNFHEESQSCVVQQHGTGTVFVKPAPTEENRG